MTNRTMRQRVLSAFILLAVVFPQAAHGQFLKKLFGSKHKHTYTAPPKPKLVKRKKEEVTYPPTVHKARYRVDVLAQLYLNDLVSDGKTMYKDNHMPEKAVSGVDFTEGVMLAVDTLKAMGYDMDVFIHDVIDPAHYPTALIGNKQLDTSSLVIGAVTSRDIPDVATYAKAHHINFISALSPYDADVKDNQYFTLLQPGLGKHCRFIKNELQKKYPNAIVTLFYRTASKADESAYNYLTDGDTVLTARKVLCNSMPDKAVLDLLFDSTITNVILIGIVETGTAEKLLAQLHEYYPGYRFEVYGMPSWKSIPSIHKTDALDNIGIYIPAAFYFNQNSPAGKYLERSFKARFNGHTSELVYRGFETMMWYAMLLHQYGTIFNTHTVSDTAAPFTKFTVRPQWDKDLQLLYNENEHIYLYRYQGGSYMVEGQ